MVLQAEGMNGDMVSGNLINLCFVVFRLLVSVILWLGVLSLDYLKVFFQFWMF